MNKYLKPKSSLLKPWTKSWIESSNNNMVIDFRRMEKQLSLTKYLFSQIAPLSPNSISKLFVGRFENDSTASFGDESNQSNSENNNLKHLNNAQVMETENNVEILEVISNQKTKAYNSQINDDNLGENETNDVNEGEIEVVTDKNKDEIIENKTASNIESTEEENMNIIDDDDYDDDDDYSKERFNIIAGLSLIHI